MPKRGDVVLYTQQGKTYNAIVLAIAAQVDTHVGADNEPALHLSVLFDDRKPLPLGEFPVPQTIYDVVHESHEFDADYQNFHGPDFHKNRGAGEWREAEVVDLRSIAQQISELHVAQSLSGTVPALFGETSVSGSATSEPQADGDSSPKE